MVDRPNVVWIMADQHNAKCTEWGSFPTEVHTPNLARLADEGVRFDRAFCQNPICTPSRTSQWTGQYPSNHGYCGNGGYLRHDVPSLFSVACGHGYRTGLFGKNHTPEGLLEEHVDERKGGDAHREYLRGRGRLDDHDVPDMQKGVSVGASLDGRPSDLPFEDHSEYYAAERAMDFIRDGDGPFCVSISSGRPHNPYVPAEQFWDQYPEEEIELAPSVDEDHEAAGKPYHHRTGHPVATPEAFSDLEEESPWAKYEPYKHEAMLRRGLRGYLGCVTEMDAVVGRVLDFLESEGLREDTIVIYSADHGDFATEHGFPEKAPGISYDAITRVPFVWSWPGRFEEGTVVDDLVETVDLFPTLCELMGADRPGTADGLDLSDYLAGDRDDPIREYAITENAWARCVRTETQKLTIYPRGFFGSDSEEFLEFYDLEADPWETDNLAVTAPEEYGEAIDRHRRLLYEHVATGRRPYTILGNYGEDDEIEAADGTISRVTIQGLLDDEDFKRNYL